MLDNAGTLVSFAQFTTGAYASYQITSIQIATETLAGFDGMISDIDIGFTGKDDLIFLMEFSTNSTVIGGPDSTLFLQNKNIILKTGSTSIMLDGNNDQMTIDGPSLRILSTLAGDLDLGGFSIKNCVIPSTVTQVANKQYVDGFFDQLVA